MNGFLSGLDVFIWSPYNCRVFTEIVVFDTIFRKFCFCVEKLVSWDDWILVCLAFREVFCEFLCEILKVGFTTEYKLARKSGSQIFQCFFVHPANLIDSILALPNTENVTLNPFGIEISKNKKKSTKKSILA